MKLRRLLNLNINKFFIIGFCLLLVFPFYSDAQQTYSNMDVQRLSDKIDSMEKDLNMLQKETYKNTRKKNKGSTDAANAEADYGEMDEQMRSIGGRIEESQHKIDELSLKLNKEIEDINYRLNKLENNQNNPTAQPQTNNTQSPSNKQSKINQPQENSANGISGSDDTTDVSGILQDADVVKNSNKIDNNDNSKNKGVDAQAQYSNAFALLRDAKYEEAESAFKNFIQNNKDNKLIGNAYYWLAETYYVRKDFKNSAINYLKVYQSFPKGEKAPESLYKLGMSMNKLSKVKEACVTFTKFAKEYPKASDTLKSKVKTARAKLEC